MIQRTIRNMLSSTDIIIFTQVLPDELNLIIFQFLPMSDIILSISNVCQSWRRDYCFPLILNYLRQVDTNNTNMHFGNQDHDENNVESGGGAVGAVVVKEFADLFRTRIGRSLMRRSLRERLYQLACQLIDGIMMNSQLQNNYTLFSGGVSESWWMYREEWQLLIEQFKSYKDLKDKFDMNNQQIMTTTITKDDSTTVFGGIVSGVLNYLSSFFTKQNDSHTTTAAAANSSLKRRNYKVGFKCVMAGESNVGKTSFINCLVKHRPCSEDDCCGSSISASFFSHRYTFGDGSLISLEMWDTAGQERYRTMAPMYYRGGDVAFCMFDLSVEQQQENQSLKSAETVVHDIKKNSLKKECEMILIGNKSDKLNQCDDHSSLTLSRVMARSLSLNEMNGALYVEMNNMDIKYAHYVSLYAAMMIYMINGGLR